MKGGGAGRDDQLVVRQFALFPDHYLAAAINGNDLFAEAAGDAVFGIPAIVMRHDFFERLLARQDGGEHDAVVIAARFGVEQRDLEWRARFEQMLQHPSRGHACADDDQSFHALRSLTDTRR